MLLCDMFILNRDALAQALKRKGFSGFSELSETLGIHRNTLNRYLQGEPVLPKSIDAVLSILDLKPEDALIESVKDRNKPLQQIAGIVDELNSLNPNVAIVLFGSRSRKKHHKYSDFDIGVYSAKKLNHSDYLKLRRRASELFEKQPFNVDFVNLHNADASFLDNIRRTWQFLGGSMKSWLDLQNQAERTNNG
jgi:predicted nucleotidyltransferase